MTSTTEIEPILAAIAESAAKICDAYDAVIFVKDGDELALRAHHGPIPMDFARFPVGRDWVVGRAFADRKQVHVRDLLEEADEFPAGHDMALRMGHRTILAVPLLRDGDAVGAIVIRRMKVRSFTKKQIGVLESFANQAAMAVENVRLLGEVEARTTELTEALEQQTATAEVLKAITRSAFDLQAVLDRLIESAAKLGGSGQAALFLRDGDVLRYAGSFGVNDKVKVAHHRSMPIDRRTSSGRAVLTGEPQLIPDVRDDPDYDYPAITKWSDIRSLLAVPLIRQGRVEGAFSVGKSEPGPFTRRQCELVQTFADQAVIAIENVLLFEEVQARTLELTAALQQQTATAEVLKAISHSTFNLDAVLQTLVDSAAGLCKATYGGIMLRQGDKLTCNTLFGASKEDLDDLRSRAYPIDRSMISGRVVLSGKIEHIPDVHADPDHGVEHLPWLSATHGMMGVPLLREGKVEGVFFLSKPEPGAFTARQAELIQSLADQAVIAIENVRLFDEVQARNRDLTEALEQQTATGEILRAIAASPTAVQPVLDAVAESAARLCDAYDAAILLQDGDSLAWRAHFGSIPITLDKVAISRDWVTGRAFLDRVPIHIHDLQSAGDEYPVGQALAANWDFHTFLGVPLLREGEAIGVIGIRRKEIRPFTQKQINLVSTFADQAVIAIENVRLFEEEQARNRELTATSAILRAIAASPTDIRPVLDAVAESAAKLCEAFDSLISLRDGDSVSVQAHHGPLPFDSAIRPIERDWTVGRSILDGKPVHVHDIEQAGDEFPRSYGLAQEEGQRTILSVPLLRDKQAIGAITVRRTEARAFTDKQIALLTTFADQAVIAIENVRLFEQVQSRSRELSEALQQQTATADVLKTISRSAFDLPTVLNALAVSAAKLCNADHGGILLREADHLRFGAEVGTNESSQYFLKRQPIAFDRTTVSGRVALSGRVEHIPDVDIDTEYDPEHRRQLTDAVTMLGRPSRAIMGVPLLREGRVEGVFFLSKQEPGAFTDHQAELVQTFADQAVIAIENVRLFEEVQARTQELTASLQQQTATADVLKAISRSAFDLDSVLHTLVESSMELCRATGGNIHLRDGDVYRTSQQVGWPEAFKEHMRQNPIQAGSNSVSGRAIATKKTVNVTDVLDMPGYQYSEGQKLAGYRAMLGVPLIRDDEVIGVFSLGRDTPEAFTQREIELVETFADQAVMAIQNVRLFEEVEARNREVTEALQQQTATAEVLQVISRSAFDLQTVLDALVGSAARLCEVDGAIVCRRHGEVYNVAATYGITAEFKDYMSQHPVLADRASVTGRAIVEGRPVQVQDVLTDPEYGRQDAQSIGGWRAILAVPLLREGNPIGTIALFHTTPRPFTPRQVELVATFADQAVIAIENVRLLEEVQARTAELTESLEYQTAISDVLAVISSSPDKLEPVLDTIVETANRLCGADRTFFSLHRQGAYQLVASYGAPQKVVDALRAQPISPDRGSPAGRAILERRAVHIPDAQSDPEFTLYDPTDTTFARTILSVPLVRNDEVVGVISAARMAPRPFNERQIDLVTTFARQAVIAINNVSLFEEVEARNRDIAEALAQQTATADVLKAISQSTFNLDAVLQTLVESAAGLCKATYGGIMLRKGDQLTCSTLFGSSKEDLDDLKSRSYPIDRSTLPTRVAHSGMIEHIPDVHADPEIGREHLPWLGAVHGMMGVPLLREGKVEGVFFLGKPETGAFTDRQAELVQTFADQAVIAIENVRLFEEVQARTRELQESLDHQTATSELLEVIGRSTTDLQPVFGTLAESAVRLCEAERAFVFRFDGELLRAAAWHGVSPELVAMITSHPVRLGRQTIAARAGAELKTVHVHDVQADPEYTYFTKDVDPIRTVLAVPMLRGDELLGVTVIYRAEVRPFSPGQVALMETFSDQAVIAIENARLFEEVQARTRELTESLEYQTATSEVLNVISRSATDVQPVFEAIVKSASQLFAPRQATITTLESGQLIWKATGGKYLSEKALERTRAIYPLPFDPERSPSSLAISERRIVELLDAAAPDAPAFSHKVHQATGVRSMCFVPLLREGAGIGSIILTHAEPGLKLSAKQRALVQTFADQAVIAIDNARLFEEVQARNREVTEALQQQTATAEVLKTISSSAFDLDAVLGTLVKSAAQLCRASNGIIALRNGDVYLLAQQIGLPREISEYMRANPVRAGRDSVTARVALTAEIVHVPDALDDPDYAFAQSQKFTKDRTLIGVPLLRNGELMGVFTLARPTVQPFSPREIDLVRTFADQAVIAIENVRLFKEVEARTLELARSVGELEALGEVSQAVNSTLDLHTVLETIVAKAVQLSDTDAGAIYVYSKSADRFRLRATYGMSPELITAVSGQAIGLNDAGIGDSARQRVPVQVPDLAEGAPSPVQRIVLEAGFRAVLVVPLLRPRKIVGALVVRRRTPGQFSDATVRLMETFAAQSVLAIQNARMFSEIEEKGREIEIASRHKSQFLANMSHELRTPLNSVLGFTEMLVDGLYGELPEKAKTTLGRVQANGKHLLGLINDVLDLAKIEAGQLTLTIEDYSIGQIVKAVAATTEPLARAKGLKLTATVADALPFGRGDERRLSQVLLNLVGNAVKFTDHGGIEIAAIAQDGHFEVRVRDTGLGIAPEHQARIFEEFQQVDQSSTRRKGGSGLGLAISKRIVEMHGGRIGLDSAPGTGSTFCVILPIRAGEGATSA